MGWMDAEKHREVWGVVGVLLVVPVKPLRDSEAHLGPGNMEV